MENNALATLEQAFISSQLSAEVTRAGVSSDRVAGVSHLVRAGFSVDASSGEPKLVAKSGRPVEDELRDRFADPAFAPLVGPLAGAQAPAATAQALGPEATWADRAIAYDKAKFAVQGGSGNPYDPLQTFARMNGTQAALPPAQAQQQAAPSQGNGQQPPVLPSWSDQAIASHQQRNAVQGNPYSPVPQSRAFVHHETTREYFSEH